MGLRDFLRRRRRQWNGNERRQERQRKRVEKLQNAASVGRPAAATVHR